LNDPAGWSRGGLPVFRHAPAEPRPSPLGRTIAASAVSAESGANIVMPRRPRPAPRNSMSGAALKADEAAAMAMPKAAHPDADPHGQRRQQHGDHAGLGQLAAHLRPHHLRAFEAGLRVDPQTQVLRLASAAAEADRHLADAEARVVAAARQHWCGSGATHQAAPPTKVLQPA